MRPELSQSLAFLGHLAEQARVEPLLFGTAVLELLGIGDFQASDLDVIVSVDAHGRRFRCVSLADLRRFYRLAGRSKDAPKIAALDVALA